MDSRLGFESLGLLPLRWQPFVLNESAEGGEMVALKTERRVFMWRIRPRTVPAEIPKTATLEEIISILEDAKAAKKARCYLSGGRLLDEEKGEIPDEKNQIYVADIKRDHRHKTVTLLVNRGDPDAVSPAFIDANKNTVTVVHPKENQTPGWSSHLVISLQDERGGHRACFEKMSHVSSHLVLLALDKIIATAVAKNTHYTYEKRVKHGAGKPDTREKRPYRPALATSRVPSEKLERDLEQGELSGVTLTKSLKSYAGPGAKELVTQQQEKIVIRTRAADKKLAAAFIRGIANFGKEKGFEGITFHLEKLPGGQSNNPTIALDDHDALEQLYVRAQVLDRFTDFLDACYPAICVEIERKMIQIITSNHGW